MPLKAVKPGDKPFELSLTEKLSSGGEGSVYKTNLSNMVAKVYKKGHADENKYRKCLWLIDNKMEYDGICLPAYILADEEDNFSGYIMPEASGDTLASLIHPLELKERYPKLKRVHLVDVCISLLEQVIYLHDNGIVIYDPDMANILVDGLGTDEVNTFIIDCDSFQIGAGASMILPGDVGRPLTVPPELQGIPYGKQARTFSNEYFSIAVILFKILVPNQEPYMMRNGENDISKLVEAGLFPYPANPSEGNLAAIPSKWAADTWKSMPEYITGLFWDNLHKDGKCHAPQDRTAPKEWLSVLRQYKAELLESEEDDEAFAFPEEKRFDFEDGTSGDGTAAVQPSKRKRRIRRKSSLKPLVENRKKESPIPDGEHLLRQSGVFKETANFLSENSDWEISIFVAMVLLYILFIFDPAAWIDKAALPGFASDPLMLVLITWIPLCVVIAVLYTVIIGTYTGLRVKHYKNLHDKVKKELSVEFVEGEIVFVEEVKVKGELPAEYKRPVKTLSELRNRETAGLVILVAATVAVSVFLLYFLIGVLSGILP